LPVAIGIACHGPCGARERGSSSATRAAFGCSSKSRRSNSIFAALSGSTPVSRRRAAASVMLRRMTSATSNAVSTEAAMTEPIK
jgi:hypothetical protein